MCKQKNINQEWKGHIASLSALKGLPVLKLNESLNI